MQKCEDELSQKFQNQIEQQRKDWQEENRKNLEKVPAIYYVITFRRERGVHKKPIFGLRGGGVPVFYTVIARKSALEKTQLSDVLITDNLF